MKLKAEAGGFNIQFLSDTSISIYADTNLPFAELCRFPQIRRELHDGYFSLPFLLDTSISSLVGTSDPVPNLPFAELC